MKLFLSLILLSAICSCSSQPENVIKTDLNGAKGKVFRVDMKQNSFELLKETVYDPKTNEGRSRFKVYWNEETKFRIIKEQKDFAGVKGAVWADFHPVNERHAKSMISGKPFHAKTVTFKSGLERRKGMSSDMRHFVALFTPNPDFSDSDCEFS